MSRTDKIPSLEEARQARTDDVRGALATVARRAGMLGVSNESWENAADVLDAVVLALSEGDSGALAAMAELARKGDRSRQVAFDLEGRRNLCAALQDWDGASPPVEAVARWFLERAHNLALKYGAEGKPDESYLTEEVTARVAAELGRVLPECHRKPDQGVTLARAGLRALGVDEKTARSKLDFSRRDRGE